MTTAGGLKSDFTSAHHITYGEARPLRWTVKDADGAEIADFTSWTFRLFVLTDGSHNGLTDLAAEAVLELTEGDGLTVSAPNVTWLMRAADWAALGEDAGVWHYELWRADAGNENRLAYGTLRTVD